MQSNGLQKKTPKYDNTSYAIKLAVEFINF